MIEAERIAARERAGVAWALCDMLHQAARDEHPSPAALALLAAFRDRAPREVAALIDRQGLAILTTLHADQAAIGTALKLAAEDMAAEWLARIVSQDAVRYSHRGEDARYRTPA